MTSEWLWNERGPMKTTDLLALSVIEPVQGLCSCDFGHAPSCSPGSSARKHCSDQRSTEQSGCDVFDGATKASVILLAAIILTPAAERDSQLGIDARAAIAQCLAHLASFEKLE